MALQERVSKLEGAYEQVDGRLSDLRSDMGEVRPRNEQPPRRDEHHRFDQMDRRFNNLYLLIGGMWATSIGAIVGFALTL